jgi:hypothetical protein
MKPLFLLFSLLLVQISASVSASSPLLKQQTQYIYLAAWSASDNEYFISGINSVTEGSAAELKKQFLEKINNGGYGQSLLPRDIIETQKENKLELEKTRLYEIQKRMDGKKRVIVIQLQNSAARNSTSTNQSVRLKNDEGEEFDYTGGLKNNLPDGKGTLKYVVSGEICEGYFLKGKVTGTGIYRFKSGSRYEGEFSEGVMNGKGTYYFANGKKYVGDFVNGAMEGYGKFYDNTGNIITEGRYKNNAFVE